MASERAMQELLRAGTAIDEDRVRQALAAGLDKDLRMREGATLLHAASMSDSAGIARALIEAGANADAMSDAGASPLHVCCKYDSVRVALVLLQAGANIHPQMVHAGGPLHVAARFGSVRVARLLLEAGAPVDAPLDLDLGVPFLIAGATPLHCCAGSAFGAAVAGLLLAARADTNAQDDLGGTPLHVSSRTGHVGVATILLEAGADSNVRDDDGKTPLERCSAAHGVAELLLLEGLHQVSMG